MKLLDLFFQSSSTPSGAENLNIINESTESIDQPSGSSPKKMTALKEAVSWGSAFVSLFSLSLTGEKFPIYKGSKANKFLDNAIAKFSTENKVINTGKKVVHGFFKELFSVGGIAINTGLFLLNGSSLPLFKDSLIGGAATKIANTAKTWWNETAAKPSILGKICKGLSHLHETKNNFITSKFTYNTLAFGLTIVCLGAGPIGWGIGAGVLAADVTLGAIRVKRIHDLEDELNYLTLLKSMDPVGVSRQAAEATERKDELNQAVIKASKSSLIHQVAPVASIVTSAINPVNIGVTAAQALLSAAAITTNKLSEEEARQLMEERISNLRTELGVDKMSKEELGRKAFEAAKSVQGEEIAKQNPIFSNSKLNPGIGSAIINSFKYIGNYIHPFKKPTSYVKSLEKLELHINKPTPIFAKNSPVSAQLSPEVGGHNKLQTDSRYI